MGAAGTPQEGSSLLLLIGSLNCSVVLLPLRSAVFPLPVNICPGAFMAEWRGDRPCWAPWQGVWGRPRLFLTWVCGWSRARHKRWKRPHKEWYFQQVTLWEGRPATGSRPTVPFTPALQCCQSLGISCGCLPLAVWTRASLLNLSSLRFKQT